MPLWLGCAIGERTRTSGQEPQRSGGFPWPCLATGR